jgi:cytochrome P450
MAQAGPVSDWATDFDVMDPVYVGDPFPIWDDLRATGPVAHTDRRNGAWLLTTYADVTEAAHDIATFSSLKIG